MATQTVTKACEQCGHDFRTRRPDRAKYCSFCAAANGILHFKFREEKCFACKAVFCPASARDSLCASCDNGIRFCRDVVKGKCHYCGTPDVTLADKDIPVCFSCWKSPDVRPKLVTTLALKKAKRIKDNAAATAINN